MSVAFFDLDRTLLSVNSANLWFKREWQEKRISRTELLQLLSWLARYKIGLAANDTSAFDRAALSLKGTSEQELRRRVHHWFNDEVRHLLRPGAEYALANHRALGHRLVLATSGSTYSAEIASEAYGLDDFVATQFSVDEHGHFNGRIEQIAYGSHKEKAVSKWATREGVDLAECWFYTDSMTDVALLRRVGNPMVINPDRRLRREAKRAGWDIKDWGSRRY